MFICLFFVQLFIDLFVLCFNHLGTPTGSYPKNFVKIGLDLAEILRIRKLDWEMFIRLFVCLFVCWNVFLIILGHPQEYTLKISRGSDLIWLRYSRSKTCLFVGLYNCLFVDQFVFYLNHLGTPTGIYPENFVKIPLDLAEILRIRKLDWKMFICLFVCLFVYIFVIFLL